jgi:multisubunit Na+/H+ antiporter MnhB subunit
MKRSIIIITLLFSMTLMPYGSYAADVGPIFTTPLLGATIGASLGYLTTLFSHHPTGHYNSNVSSGAGIGLVAGLILGIYGLQNASASFYQRDTNKERLYGLNINIPLK